MRQIITLCLAIVAFGALIHIVAAQSTAPIVSTAVRRFAFSNFTRSDELNFNVENTPHFGGANNTLTMSDYDPYGSPEKTAVGVVWYKTRLQLDSFNTTFTVSMSNLSHTGIGNPDGFALVVQNYRANAFGPANGGIGYGATPDYDDIGVRKSVAIEFDTFENEELDDPNSNHISVHYATDALLHNSANEDDALNPPGPSTNIPPIAGYTHKYNVQYVTKTLTVYIDDNPTPAYQGTIDLASVLSLNSSGAFMGLTSSCSATCEDINVLSWYFNYISMVDYTKSYVTNFRNTSVAGRTSSFIIQGVDTNGYLYQTGGDASKFSVTFTPVNITGTVGTASVLVADRGDGSYLVSYSPTTAGWYNVTVLYNSNSLPNMPLLLWVGPAPVDPTQSVLSGNVGGGVAGVVQNITILGRDAYGNVNPNNNPPAFFTASFNPSALAATSTFVGNGTYLLQYTLTTATTYTMAVTYNSTTQQVRGSPFTGITITAASPAASTSTASNVGTMGGTAGVSLPVTVVVRDMYGNNVTSDLPAGYQLLGLWNKPAAGNNVTFSRNADGTFGGNYAVNVAGTYSLSIVLFPSGQAIARSPFAVTITPQTTTSAGQSIAYGSGLLSATAGYNATFTVQARDSFGNNMTASSSAIAVSFTDDSGTPLNLYATAVQNTGNTALYTVTYVPTAAIGTRITVTLDGASTMGAPYRVVVQPGPLDPRYCFASLGSVIPKVKVPLEFGITTADKYNNRLTSGGATFDVSFKEMKSGAVATGVITDMNNGEYHVAVTFVKSGIYNATINANGVPIGNGQAYSVTVPSAGLGLLGWTVIIVVILALVAVVGGGAFWYLKYYKSRHEYDEIGA